VVPLHSYEHICIVVHTRGLGFGLPRACALLAIFVHFTLLFHVSCRVAG